MLTAVVVGAGIVGASAAYRLSAAGARVTVLDNGAAGGATAAGAGIIATVGSRPTDLDSAAFRFEAARHYLALAQACNAAGLPGHSYAGVGQLVLALDDCDAERLPTDLAGAQDLVRRFGTAAVGIPELLSAAAVGRRFPLVGPSLGGLWLPEVARVDGHAMRNALLRLAAARGATTVDDTGRLEITEGRVVGVRTEQRLYPADAVIVAAGAWSGGLTPGPGPRVEPQRGQIVHLHLPGAGALPILDTHAGHYLLSFPDDRVVIGATREPGTGFAPELTAGGIAQVLAQGLSLVPGLAGARWIEARVGLRPASHDGFPYLGAGPGVDGLWLATGMGPAGLTLGPYCGAVIADHLLASLRGGTAPDIPASYHPGRA